MTWFDLLFVGVFFASGVSAVAIVIMFLLGRRRAGLHVLIALAACLVVYFAADAAVALSAVQRIVPMGEDRCFDDLCFSVVNARTVPALGPTGGEVRPSGRFYLVTVRAASRALHRPQRELGVSAELIDSRGHVYLPSSAGERALEAEHGANPALTSLLMPGEAVYSIQVFDVPVGASGLAVHFAHDGPGLFIIGDDENPMHKPTITPLPPQ